MKRAVWLIGCLVVVLFVASLSAEERPVGKESTPTAAPGAPMAGGVGMVMPGMIPPGTETPPAVHPIGTMGMPPGMTPGQAPMASLAAYRQFLFDSVVDSALPRLGHRNWIVVADWAYPAQVSPGVQTVVVEVDHVDAVKRILEKVEAAPHVRPIVYLDSELDFVPEAHAKGIEKARAELMAAVEGHEVEKRPHETTIAALDEAGQTFEVLLLKTKMTLPYTSVFICLDCGYWSAEAEATMREAMKQARRRKPIQVGFEK